MKNVCLLILSIVLIFGGCKEYSNKKLKSFIPGTYVAKWNDEFANTCDTIIIVSQSENKDFQITQIMRSQFLNKSKMPLYKIHHWTASFDEVNKCLLITNNGRMLFYYPEKNELKSGTIIFKKTK
jgi:hypothetical protein